MRRVLGLLCLFSLSCSANAGMFCQRDGDCSFGLLCAKPPHPQDSGKDMHYGVCSLPAPAGQDMKLPDLKLPTLDMPGKGDMADMPGMNDMTDMMDMGGMGDMADLADGGSG